MRERRNGQAPLEKQILKAKEEIMPYSVVFLKGTSRPWKIVKEGGKVVGSSNSKADAEASMRARYAAENKGTGGPVPYCKGGAVKRPGMCKGGALKKMGCGGSVKK